MHKLTANQQAGAWELLRKRRVAYITGDAQGCTGRVESRSDPGRWYEVQIGTDRRGLWFRCECQFNEHRPSRMCTHIAALWIVWQAVNPTGGRHELQRRTAPDEYKRQTVSGGEMAAGVDGGRTQREADMSTDANLYQRLLAVQKAVTRITKDQVSGGRGAFKYVSSSHLLQTIREAMDANGLVLEVTVVDYTLHLEAAYASEDKRGQHLTELMVELTWVNVDNPEERVSWRIPGQGIDPGEKGIGKALTYAEKYGLLKWFHIGTDDVDPDATQNQPPSETAAPPAGRAQRPNVTPVTKLRQRMTDELNIPAEQHQATLDELAGKPVDMAKLSTSACEKAWAKLAATHNPTEPDAPMPMTSHVYTQDQPPTPQQLQALWDEMGGLDDGRKAAIADKAGFGVDMARTPDACWLLYEATMDMMQYDETGKPIWRSE